MKNTIETLLLAAVMPLLVVVFAIRCAPRHDTQPVAVPYGTLLDAWQGPVVDVEDDTDEDDDAPEDDTAEYA